MNSRESRPIAPLTNAQLTLRANRRRSNWPNALAKRCGLAALLATYLAAPALGQDGAIRWVCPEACADTATQCLREPASRDRTVDDSGKVTVDFGEVQVDNQDNLDFSGGVEFRQGERTLRAQEMHRDAQGQWHIPGPVELSDPTLVLRGDHARLAESGEAQIDGASYEILDRDGRGVAERIVLSKNGEVELLRARYTTCPGPNPDWALKVGKLRIDADARTGTATNARIEIKGVPIFVLPYISFPVGDARKSGLLFPEIGNSDFSGQQISLPWYWNIAPNYDATITPTWYSKRGLDLGTEFRALTRTSRAVVNVNYLPDDDVENADRSYLELHAVTMPIDRLRVAVDGTHLSDRLWLEHFGSGAEVSGVTVLPRSVEALYGGDEWRLDARVQDHLTIDDEITLSERPYSLLPQVTFRGRYPGQPLGLALGLDAEYSNFRAWRNDREFSRDTNPTGDIDLRVEGERLDATPEVRLPLRYRGLHLEPSAAWRYTAYRLDQPVDGFDDDEPTRSAPVLSLDSGMIFERPSGRSGQRLQTLEPRALYLYVPYRQQDELPIFDTTLPDFSLVQLFRTSRYVGPDRLGDANQLAMGVTTRLLDSADARQYLSATVGGLYRFATPRILLPGEPPDETSSTDVIGEMSLTAYKDWSAGAGLQWDPNRGRFERTELSLQYRPDEGRVINAGYRFREDPLASEDLEQVEASGAWPIGRRFNLYARYVYSLEDSADIERLAGVEYRDCCWGFRFVIGQTVSLTGDTNNYWHLQVELKGLPSVGHRVDAFLAEAIRGYSATCVDRRSTP